MKRISLAAACVAAVLGAAARATPVTAAPPAAPSATLSQNSAWIQVWRDVEELSRRTAGTPPFRELAAALERVADQREEPARKERDRVERFRVRVLRAQLARLSGTPWTPIKEPVVEIPWLAGEAWLAAQVLQPGKVRDRALLHAIEHAGAPVGPELAPWLSLAAPALREATSAARLDDAEALALAIDVRRPSAESAGELARVHALRGDRVRARALLAERLARAAEPAEQRALLGVWGEIELAEPASALASQHLGAAFARGSEAAGLLLARRAFDAGERARARALYRALSEIAADPDLANEASRGWGLACLADEASSPVTERTSAP